MTQDQHIRARLHHVGLSQRLRRAEGATLKELAQTYDVGLTTIFRISKIVQPMRESSEDYSNSTVFKATNADHSLAD
jgi:hypothetical protein